MIYTTILMDADDTVFDFHKCEYNAVKNTFEKYNIKFTQLIYEKYSEVNDNLWKQFEQGKITRQKLRIQRFEQICKFFNITNDDNIINDMADTYVEELSKQDIFIKGAYDAVKKISKLCDVYIITNGLAAVQRRRFVKSPVTEFLKDIFISDELGVQKPQKEFFDIVLEKIDEKNKSKILVVGDSLTSDMQGGKNAGLATCLYDFENKVTMPNNLCDYKITVLEDLCKIIKGK